MLATIVFVPFVLPALILAYAGRALPLAAFLTVIGGILYSMDPLMRLTSVVGNIPLTAVFILGVVGALVGIAAMPQTMRHLAIRTAPL